MRFERSLRPYIPQKEGASALTERGSVIDERAILSTVGSPHEEGDFKETEALPQLIKLRLVMRPFFIEKGVMGSCTYQGKKYEGCMLWKKDRPPLRKIELAYTGQGQFFSKQEWRDFTGFKCNDYILTIPPKNVLYAKDFITLAEESISLDMTLNTKDGTTFDHSFDKAYRPLWGYGGSFYPQVKVADIGQYYLTLDQDGHKTIVQYHSQKSLLERGLRLSQGQGADVKGLGKVILINEEVAGYHRSLEEDIVSGLIEFSLGKIPGSTYISTGVKQLGVSHFMEITFQRKGTKA